MGCGGIIEKLITSLHWCLEPYIWGMNEGYSSFKIAAFFIRKAHADGRKLTPMQLIKLVYIAHAWNLVFQKKPLIGESVQAWKYGPVIESLYHSFKRFGNSDIPKEETDSLPETDDIDSNTKDLLEKIWAKYGILSGTHLSSLTHLGGTPWDTVWNKNGGNKSRYAHIPNQLIQEFYEEKLANPNSGSGH